MTHSSLEIIFKSSLVLLFILISSNLSGSKYKQDQGLDCSENLILRFYEGFPVQVKFILSVKFIQR